MAQIPVSYNLYCNNKLSSIFPKLWTIRLPLVSWAIIFTKTMSYRRVPTIEILLILLQLTDITCPQIQLVFIVFFKGPKSQYTPLTPSPPPSPPLTPPGCQQCLFPAEAFIRQCCYMPVCSVRPHYKTVLALISALHWKGFLFSNLLSQQRQGNRWK